MKKEFVCIVCPIGCRIQATVEDNQILSIEGNRCPRGQQYVTQELTNPQRVLTSTMRVRNGDKKLVSVKSSSTLPKDQLQFCVSLLEDILVEAPITMNQVLVENIMNLGVDIIATTVIKKED